MTGFCDDQRGCRGAGFITSLDRQLTGRSDSREREREREHPSLRPGRGPRRRDGDGDDDDDDADEMGRSPARPRGDGWLDDASWRVMMVMMVHTGDEGAPKGKLPSENQGPPCEERSRESAREIRDRPDGRGES